MKSKRAFLNQSDLAAISDALRELYAHTDARSLPYCIVRLVRKLIPANSAAFNSFDFRTGQASLAHDHGPEGDKYFPALQDRIQEHPMIVARLTGQWRDGSVALSDCMSQAKFHRHPLYDEFFRPLGIERQLGLIVEDKEYGFTAACLQRDGKDFSTRDQTVLTFLQPHIIQAFKNASDMTALRMESGGLKGLVNLTDAGAAWLSNSGKIEWMSSKAELWLNEYFGEHKQGAQRTRLPGRLAEWVKMQRMAQESNSSLGWRAEWTITRERGDLNVRWICEQPGHGYLILSERRRNSSPERLRALGLTSREAEALYWIAEGKSNAEIGVLMGISVRTVAKHLEQMFPKLGVESRLQAAMLANETGGQSEETDG